MENMPNRKQRRQMAKEAGLIKKKQEATFLQKLEMNRRASKYGKEIHRANVERNLRAEEERQLSKEQKRLEEYLSKGMTYQEAVDKLQSENED
jgi:hypothetical protein